MIAAPTRMAKSETLSTDVSVIIVNWNSAHFVKKCIESIYQHTRDVAFEIIVVDNSSHDACGAMLAAEFPRVTFVQSETNLGFAGANNLGYRHSSGANLLFLNPDTELMDAAINAMLAALHEAPEAGAIGCTLLNSDRSLQTSCIQRFPTIANQAFDLDYLKLRLPRLPIFGIEPLFVDLAHPVEVEIVSGACLLIKREIFETIGRFSTDYFMYAEDVDLCYNVRRHGYRVYYTNRGTVVHHGGGSSKQASVGNLNDLLKRESIALFLEKTRGTRTASLYRGAMALVSLLRLAVIFPLLACAWVLRCTDRVRPKLIKWKRVLRWSLGKERWVEKLGDTKEPMSADRMLRRS